MKTRKIPMRMCVGCREMKEKKALLRIVRSAQGEISFDRIGISRPLLKLSGGHFLFQVASIVRFVCAIVREPDRIIFAFIVIPFAGTDIAAGFAGLVFQRAIAIAGILSGGE